MKRKLPEADIDATIIAQANDDSAWDSPIEVGQIRKVKVDAKKKVGSRISDELRSEYDLRALLKNSVRGKYATKYRAGTNLVLLDPDIAKAFPTGQAVNQALRLVLELNQISQPRKRKHSHA